MEQLTSLYTFPSLINVVATSYLFIELVLRRFNKYLRLPIPPLAVTTGACILISTIFYWAGVDRKLTFLMVHDVFYVFVPLYIITSIYKIELFVHVKALLGTCVLCWCVLLGTGSLLSIVMRYILHPYWDWTEAMLASLVVLPVQQTHALRYLCDMTKYNNIERMLEVETIGSFMVIHIVFRTTLQIYNGDFPWDYYDSVMLPCQFLIGGLIGMIFAKISTSFINTFYEDVCSALTFLLGVVMLIYVACRTMLMISGDIAVVVLATNVIVLRYKFATEVDRNIMLCFRTIRFVLEVTGICLYLIVTLPFFWENVSLTFISSSLLLYVVLICARISSYLLFGFLIKSLSVFDEYDARIALILGLHGLKGTFNLLLCFMLMINPKTYRVGSIIMVEFLLVYIYTMLLNIIPIWLVVRVVGLNKLSKARQQNMNFCLKQVLTARSVTIQSIRTFNYLADVHWKAIRKATEVRHPYTRTIIDDLSVEDTGVNTGVFRTSTAICPQCSKPITYDLTLHDIIGLCEEAQIKLLRAKKVSVSRQYETDAINVKCLQLVIYFIDLSLYSNDKNVRVNVRSYLKPQKLAIAVRKCVGLLLKSTLLNPPKNNCNRVFYYFTNHVLYDCILLALAIVFVGLTCHQFMDPMTSKKAIFHLVLIIIFGVDLVLRLSGYQSFRYLRKSCMLIFTFLQMAVEVYLLYESMHNTGRTMLKYSISLRVIAILRIVYVLLASRFLLLTVAHALDNNINAKLLFGFELTSALQMCCEENLDNIREILDVNLIRKIYSRDVQNEMAYLITEIRRIEMAYPSVTMVMKTKQAIYITLCHLQEGINDLNLRGLINSQEHNFIRERIIQRLKQLRTIAIVQPVTAKGIFDDIPWLSGNTEITQYLYEKVKWIYFDPGDIVIRNEQEAPGVYVVISGRFKLIYKANMVKTFQMKKRGCIPIVDYLATLDFESDLNDDLSTGSTFGERSILTHRRYDCTIVADVHVQAFMLSNDVLQEAFGIYNDPITGLEAMMWKYCTIHLAIAIMSEASIYKIFSKNDIKFKLDRAFVPTLRCYKAFTVLDEMDDLVLVEGIAMDPVTKKVFYAPALIPKYVRRLYVSKNDNLRCGTGMDTKLMIVPLPNVTAADIMYREEEYADIVC